MARPQGFDGQEHAPQRSRAPFTTVAEQATCIRTRCEILPIVYAATDPSALQAGAHGCGTRPAYQAASY